jgi:hypothetical protein
MNEAWAAIIGSLIGGAMATVGGFAANWYAARLARTAESLKLRREKLEEFAKLACAHDVGIDLAADAPPPPASDQLLVLAILYFPQVTDQTVDLKVALNSRAILFAECRLAGTLYDGSRRKELLAAYDRAERFRVNLLKALAEIAKEMEMHSRTEKLTLKTAVAK